MALPLLFTLSPSSRHEVILLDPSTTSLKALNKQLTAIIAESPNCAEFMGKYKSSSSSSTISSLKIHWDTKTRDAKIWPEYTVLTDQNFKAVVELLRTNVGRDVLEVGMGGEE